METYKGYIRTPADAIKLFEACRLGILQRVQRRLSEKERQFIKSGSVFVWDEREAGMRRWTDGKSWSASRVSGSFLTYREMEGKRGGQISLPPIQTQVCVTVPEDCHTSDDEIDPEDHENHEEPDGYRYKLNGLIKQSFSIKTLNGQNLHLISYYSRPAPPNAIDLCQPTLDPQLRHIIPAKDMYPDASILEGQTFMINRALAQPRVYPQAYEIHFQHIGNPIVSQESGDRPHQFPHSTEYQWTTPSTIKSPISSGYSNSLCNNSSLPSLHNLRSPVSSFHASSHHANQSSIKFPFSGDFNRPEMPPNISLPPGPAVGNRSHRTSLNSREKVSPVVLPEWQNLPASYSFNASAQPAPKSHLSSKNTSGRSFQHSVQGLVLTPLVPEMKFKRTTNDFPITDSPLNLISEHFKTSTATLTFGCNARNLAPIDHHCPSQNSNNSSIPSISSIVFDSESELTRNYHEKNEKKEDNLPSHLDRSKFQKRNTHVEVVREQLDFLGEDQRAIRVLDRKFCV